MLDEPQLPVELPQVPPPSEDDWRDAREALVHHATHRASCPAKADAQGECNCSAGRWIDAIKV